MHKSRTGTGGYAGFTQLSLIIFFSDFLYPELQSREERSKQYFGTDLLPPGSQAADTGEELYDQV